MDTEFETRMLRVLDILDRAPSPPPIVRGPVVIDAPLSLEPTPHVVYFILAGNRIKIGISSRLERRLSGLRTGSPTRMEVLGVIYGESRAATRAIEVALHRGFDWLSTRGEWFIDAPELRSWIAAHTKPWSRGR